MERERGGKEPNRPAAPRGPRKLAAYQAVRQDQLLGAFRIGVVNNPSRPREMIGTTDWRPQHGARVQGSSPLHVVLEPYAAVSGLYFQFPEASSSPAPRTFGNMAGEAAGQR